MKLAVVPAQVTTVEDRIIGNLSPTQVLLMIVPIFIGGGLYALIPPSMDFSVLKIAIIATLISLSSVLAIKIRGRIIATWLAILLRYYLRPRLYLLDKNSDVARTVIPIHPRRGMTDPVPALRIYEPITPYQQPGLIASQLLSDPAKNFRYTSKKGKLYVTYSKTKN